MLDAGSDNPSLLLQDQTFTRLRFIFGSNCKDYGKIEIE